MDRLQNKLKSKCETYQSRMVAHANKEGGPGPAESNAQVAGILADYVEGVADVIREAGEECNDSALGQALFDLQLLAESELEGLIQVMQAAGILVEIIDENAEEATHG